MEAIETATIDAANTMIEVSNTPEQFVDVTRAKKQLAIHETEHKRLNALLVELKKPFKTEQMISIEEQINKYKNELVEIRKSHEEENNIKLKETNVLIQEQLHKIQALQGVLDYAGNYDRLPQPTILASPVKITFNPSPQSTPKRDELEAMNLSPFSGFEPSPVRPVRPHQPPPPAFFGGKGKNLGKRFGVNTFATKYARMTAVESSAGKMGARTVSDDLMEKHFTAYETFYETSIDRDSGEVRDHVRLIRRVIKEAAVHTKAWENSLLTNNNRVMFVPPHDDVGLLAIETLKNNSHKQRTGNDYACIRAMFWTSAVTGILTPTQLNYVTSNQHFTIYFVAHKSSRGTLAVEEVYYFDDGHQQKIFKTKKQLCEDLLNDLVPRAGRKRQRIQLSARADDNEPYNAFTTKRQARAIHAEMFDEDMEAN